MTCLFLQGQSATRIRVWIDELPDYATLPQGLECDRRLILNTGAKAYKKSVAIEVFRAFGASFHYGLLGGVFEEMGCSSLEYSVPAVDPRPKRILPDSLAGRLDRVSVGGGSEFSGAVLEVISELDPRTLPSGLLTFTCMAYGEIGSAPAVFAALASATIRIMICAADNISFDAAIGLYQRASAST